MDNDANKTVVTEFIDGLFSRGDLSAVDTYLAEDFVNHDPPLGAPADREGMRSAGRAPAEASGSLPCAALVPYSSG